MYSDMISSITGLTDRKALCAVEDHMRNDVLHSTLDWLSKAQFRSAAIKALQLYVVLNDAPDAVIMRAFRIKDAASLPAWKRDIAAMRASEANPRI